MVKSLAVLALFLSIQPSYAAERTIDDVKANIKRLSDHVYEEVNTSSVPVDKLLLVEKTMQQSISLLRGEPVTPPNQMNRGDCIKFVLDKGFTPATAAQTCDTISTVPEYVCLTYVMTAGFDPNRSAKSCLNVKESEYDCFKTVMERGFGPDRARETCVR